MSASVYANPYTWRPPPPRIHYPPLFDSCGKITFRYILDSKILALAVLILLAGTFAVLVMSFLPFWFELQLSDTEGTFGGEPLMRGVKINAGLFFMREDEMDNAIFLDKFTNVDTVPSSLQAAQVFSIAGTCLLVACCGAGLILILRRFASVPALIMLAGATTLAALCHVFVMFACVYVLQQSSCEPGSTGCTYSDNLKWHMIPIYSQIYRVETTITPYVQASWGFYLAIIAVVICIVAAVGTWVEAIMNIRSLRQIRYQQLKEHRDPFEKEADAFTGHKYVYQPPIQRGPDMYGMQPVMSTPHPYEGMVIHPPQHQQAYIPPARFEPQPQQQAYIPPARFEPQPVRPPSPGFGRRYNTPSAPSDASSNSGVPVRAGAREIDL